MRSEGFPAIADDGWLQNCSTPSSLDQAEQPPSDGDDMEVPEHVSRVDSVVIWVVPVSVLDTYQEPDGMESERRKGTEVQFLPCLSQ